MLRCLTQELTMINVPSALMLHLMKFSGLTLSGLAFEGLSERALIEVAQKEERRGAKRDLKNGR